MGRTPFFKVHFVPKVGLGVSGSAPEVPKLRGLQFLETLNPKPQVPGTSSPQSSATPTPGGSSSR